MILVSFFSEDNALSDEIKICYIFEYQSNENSSVPLFWGTPGIQRSDVCEWSDTFAFCTVKLRTAIRFSNRCKLFLYHFAPCVNGVGWGGGGGGRGHFCVQFNLPCIIKSREKSLKSKTTKDTKASYN